MCSPSARNRGRTSRVPLVPGPENTGPGRLSLSRRPGDVPHTGAAPGRGIWRVNRSKWSSAAAVADGDSVRLGAASAATRQQLTTLYRVCVRVAIAAPSPPTHTFVSY